MARAPNMVDSGLNLDDTMGLPDVEIPVDAPMGSFLKLTKLKINFS